MVSERLGTNADSALSWISDRAAGLAKQGGAKGFLSVPLAEVREHDYFRLREPPYPGVDVLADEIRERGQTTPLFVRLAGPNTYDLIAGYRRLAALRRIESPTVLVRVFEGLDDDAALDLAVSENRDREDVSDWERAELAQRLQEKGRSYEAIAKVLKLSDVQVKRLLRVAKTSPAHLRASLQQRQITLAMATAFLELRLETQSEDLQAELLAAAIEEECSVREFRRLAEKRLRSKPAAPPTPPTPSYVRQLKNGAFAVSMKVVPGRVEDIDERIDALQEALKLAKKLRRETLKAVAEEGIEGEA